MYKDEFKDDLGKLTFGMTKSEAHSKQICINCKKPVRFWSLEGMKEYRISGLCEYCFDDITEEDINKCKKCQRPKSWHEHYSPEHAACTIFEEQVA